MPFCISEEINTGQGENEEIRVKPRKIKKETDPCGTVSFL